MNWPAINFFGIILVGLGVLIVLLRSRRWEAPIQDGRMASLEEEQKILRGNLRRIERDVTDWHKTSLDTNEAILKELEAIRANGAKEHPLFEEIQDLKDQVFEVERTIAAMPCAQHVLEQLNGKKENN